MKTSALFALIPVLGGIAIGAPREPNPERFLEENRELILHLREAAAHLDAAGRQEQADELREQAEHRERMLQERIRRFHEAREQAERAEQARLREGPRRERAAPGREDAARRARPQPGGDRPPMPQELAHRAARMEQQLRALAERVERLEQAVRNAHRDAPRREPGRKRETDEARRGGTERPAAESPRKRD